jgi:glutathione S-transferase
MNPKPLLTPLTGGYRRIPVLQIGADVYCDTALIARELERRQPEPTIFPGACEGAAAMLALWADHQFFSASVPLALVAAEAILPPEFKADREQMAPQMNFDRLRAALPDARNQVRAFCDLLAAQLAGGPFLLGDRFSLADAAAFHVIWFLRGVPDAKPLIRAHAALTDWFKRLQEMGRGQETPLGAEEALAIAKAAAPETRAQEDPGDPNGRKPGDRVTIVPDDYAFDPIAGEILALSSQEVAIRREDPQVGEVVVHFPRIGYRIVPVG